jgi:hypothetical protein
LELAALAFTTVVSIAVAFIVVRPYAVEWRSAPELLLWEQLELTELIAADTIHIVRATKLMRDRANTSASLFPLWRGHLIDKSKRQVVDAKK